MHRARLAALPDDCRHALAVVAAAGTATTAILPALSELGLDIGALGPGKTRASSSPTSAACVSPTRCYGPPLADTLDAATRRRVHSVLAKVTADDPERHAVHLAGATVGASKSVAAALSTAAAHAQQRGGLRPPLRCCSRPLASRRRIRAAPSGSSTRARPSCWLAAPVAPSSCWIRSRRHRRFCGSADASLTAIQATSVGPQRGPESGRHGQRRRRPGRLGRPVAGRRAPGPGCGRLLHPRRRQDRAPSG